MMKKTISVTFFLLLFGVMYAEKKNMKTITKQGKMENQDLFEKRKKHIQAYFEKVDAGIFNASYYNLFTEDME